MRLQCCIFVCCLLASLVTDAARCVRIGVQRVLLLFGLSFLRTQHAASLLVQCVLLLFGLFFLRTQHAASLLVVRFVETIILPLQNIIFYIQRYVVEIFKVAYCMVVITRLPCEIFVNLMCSMSDSGF